MASRLTLHKTFEDILGSTNVYFQPPPTYKMRYPAIRYRRNDIQNTFADNGVYPQTNWYKVQGIDKHPTSEIEEKARRGL